MGTFLLCKWLESIILHVMYPLCKVLSSDLVVLNAYLSMLGQTKQESQTHSHTGSVGTHEFHTILMASLLFK